MMRYFAKGLLLILIAFSACRSGDNTSGQNGDSDTTEVRIEALNQLIAGDAENPRLYHRRAKYFYSNHQFDNALKDINKAISLDDNNADFFITLSDVYLLMGQPQKSMDALSKALTIKPDQTEALLKLSKLYLIVKDYPKCYSTATKLLAIDKGNAQAYYTMAIGLLEQGDTLRAVDNLMKAVDKNQEFYDALVQLGELYSLKKDPMAVHYLNNALNIRPQSREVLYMLGLFYQENGQYPKAIATYQNLTRLDTAWREPSYNLGYINLVYLKDFPRAIGYFTESIKKDPEYYQAYFNRGYAYELSGDYKLAAEDYQKALKIQVNYENAIQGLNRLDKLKLRK